MPDPGLAKVPPQAPGASEYETMISHAGQAPTHRPGLISQPLPPTHTRHDLKGGRRT